VICKKCGIDGNFSWDRDWFDNTGKWRLFDQSMERPHECSHVSTQASIEEPIVTQPRVKCPQCDPLKDSAWMEREKLQHHIKTAHFGFW
jgi:hypothetical protein